jgi:hypothetical protein
MRVKRKRLAYLALVATVPIPSQATTIIAVIYGNAIYFASDSKLSYVGNPAQDAPKTGCKIAHSATRAFACAAPATDTVTGFDLNKTLTNLLSTQRTLNDWVTQSDDAIRANMPPVLDHIKRDFPAAYAARLGFILAECAFASWGSESPALIDDIWLLDRNGTLRHEPWNLLKADGKNLVVIGARSAIEEYFRGPLPPPPADERGIPPRLEMLIRLQIEASEHSPDPILGPTVGPPISILRLDVAGAHWEKQGVCEK